MEINLQFEMDLIWSKGKTKLGNLISKKYLSQLEKIYKDLYSLYVEQRVQMANLRRVYGDVRIIPPGEKRYFPTSSKFLLLCRFTNFNGYIIVSINGQEEKEYIDNLEKFLDIEVYFYQIVFRTHPNKLEIFDRKKNIKVEIKLEGVKRTAINRRLSI